MSCRTKCCMTFVFVLLALAIVATPAFASGPSATLCLQDDYNLVKGVSDTNCPATPSSNVLNCTAGDVSISQIQANTIHIISGGTNATATAPASCFQGGNVDFIADFDIVTQANATNAGGRDNVGLYFATKPPCNPPTLTTNCNTAVPVTHTFSSSALCGSCVDNIISQPHACAGDPALTCGSDNYHEFDTGVTTSSGAADNCGDTSSTDNSGTYGAGSEGVTIEVPTYFCGGPTAPCSPGSTNQCLVLQYCTSWQVPGKVIACASPTPAWPWEPAAIPGDKSKCNCSTVLLPITPVTVTPIVQKACEVGASPSSTPTFDNGLENNPPTTPTQSPTKCDLGAEGGTATIYVNISNTSNVSNNNLVVDQICDDKYGTIYSDFATPSCPTGTNASDLVTTSGTNTCPPSAISPLGQGQCQFEVKLDENQSIVDTVSVWGHSSLNTSSTFTNKQSVNTVTVDSTDAPTTASTSKSVATTPVAACVTARYTVTVANTSAAEESITLNSAAGPPAVPALMDSKFGNITNTATLGNSNTDGAVTGTTCGFDTTAFGNGTLITVHGGGTFPQTLDAGSCSGTGTCPPTSNGGTYVCQFDGVLCSPVANPFTGCSFGFSQPDTVTANLTGDDTGAFADTITQTDNQLTANICITISGQ